MKHYTVEIYKGRNGRWYWRLVAGNGEIVADGAQGYTRKHDCIRAWRRVQKQIHHPDCVREVVVE